MGIITLIISATANRTDLSFASFHVFIPVLYKVFINPGAFHPSLNIGKLGIGLYVWGVYILKKKENKPHKIRIREKKQHTIGKKTMRIEIVRILLTFQDGDAVKSTVPLISEDDLSIRVRG